MGNGSLEGEIRIATDEEKILRFVFTNNLRSSGVKKQALRVAPHPDTGRLELSVFLLDSLSAETFWEDMPRLGSRPEDQRAKGYGVVSAESVRSISGELNVEVNHDPFSGHADVIGWSDHDEEQMEQIVSLGKAMTAVKRPSEAGKLTDEHQYLADRDS